MPLFDKKNPVIADPPATAEQAAIIYGHLLDGKSATWIFKHTGHSFKRIEKVYKEAKRVEAEVLSKIAGTFKTGTEEIEEPNPLYGKDPEEPKFITKTVPVYYEYTTKADLGESVTTYLPKAQLADDISKWNPTYDEDRTWADFVSSIQNPTI
jgi:hypothetical protein